MIYERLQKSKSAVEAGKIPNDRKAELLGILSKLKSLIGELAQTDHEDAQSIARFIEASAHEATRARKKPELIEIALRGLKRSVKDFEASHPELVILVNQFATGLANMGL